MHSKREKGEIQPLAIDLNTVFGDQKFADIF